MPSQPTADPDEDVHGFVPVALDTLLPGAAYGFDLYMKQRPGGMLLYRRREYPVDQTDFDRLLSQGVRTLHVSFDDRDMYARYLNLLLVDGEDLTATQKYTLLKGAARSVLSDSLCSRSPDTLVRSVSDLSKQMVESLCGNELLLRDIFFLMTHDYYSYTHVTNVSMYCLTLAQQMGICNKQELTEIVVGALLHDIGKRHLPPQLLNKTGKLTEPEMAQMRQHPQAGFEDLCTRPDLNWGQLMMVYQHHERLNGKGYPAEVGGDEIHPWAKICAVADVFDAITSCRPYRSAIRIDSAIDFFERRMGVSFDEEIVGCLSSLMQTT